MCCRRRWSSTGTTAGAERAIGTGKSALLSRGTRPCVGRRTWGRPPARELVEGPHWRPDQPPRPRAPRRRGTPQRTTRGRRPEPIEPHVSSDIPGAVRYSRRDVDPSRPAVLVEWTSSRANRSHGGHARGDAAGLRPHAKKHKSVEIGRRQRAGARPDLRRQGHEAEVSRTRASTNLRCYRGGADKGRSLRLWPIGRDGRPVWKQTAPGRSMASSGRPGAVSMSSSRLTWGSIGSVCPPIKPWMWLGGLLICPVSV